MAVNNVIEKHTQKKRKSVDGLPFFHNMTKTAIAATNFFHISHQQGTTGDE